jgi:16S rRNA (adenine1518-N6/adenine1519-N6)-dimethyltransferase
VIRAKRLGQHFLADPNILRKIVDALDPEPTDVVLEIGAGKGSLTAALAPRVRTVIAIEKDRRLATELHGIRETGNVTIVEGDALRVDWHSLVNQAPFPVSRVPFPGFKVVGNIPYNITSPLIEKALTPPLPERIVFLVQAEVADRVAARPGSRTYGALSVGVQAVCGVEKLFAVRAGAFQPAPRVTSAVLRLSPLATPLIAPAQAERFRAFVTACFSQRRKQLRNALAAATGRGVAEVAGGLRTLGIDPGARPETLAPETFARLLRWSG